MTDRQVYHAIYGGRLTYIERKYRALAGAAIGAGAADELLDMAKVAFVMRCVAPLNAALACVDVSNA